MACAGNVTAFSIRRATVADRSIICGKHCAIHLATTVRDELELQSQIKDLPSDFPGLFSDKAFTAPEARYWVACDEGGSIIGNISTTDHIAADASSDLQSKDAIITYLNEFSVSFDHRGRGIGFALMKSALLDSHERGVNKVTLLTIPEVMEPAVKLYRSVGFVTTREYRGNNYHLVDMEINASGLQTFVESQYLK